MANVKLIIELNSPTKQFRAESNCSVDQLNPTWKLAFSPRQSVYFFAVNNPFHNYRVRDKPAQVRDGQ